MAQTRRQKKREQIAELCEQISRRFDGRPSQSAKTLRATNRRVEKRKTRSR